MSTITLYEQYYDITNIIVPPYEIPKQISVDGEFSHDHPDGGRLHVELDIPARGRCRGLTKWELPTFSAALLFYLSSIFENLDNEYFVFNFIY